MKAEEIRNYFVPGNATTQDGACILEVLAEIAAQLAELNHNIQPGNLIANVEVIQK